MTLKCKKCNLEKIDSEIKKLEIVPEFELETYTRDCPTCGETFYYELEKSDVSEKEANDVLNEMVSQHIKEIHQKNKVVRRQLFCFW